MVLKGLTIRDIRHVAEGICIEFKHSEPHLEAWIELTIPFNDQEEANGCYEFFTRGADDHWCLIENSEGLGAGYRAINVTSGGHYWSVRPINKAGVP